MRYTAKKLAGLAIATTMVFGSFGPTSAILPSLTAQAATVSSTDITRDALNQVGVPFKYGGASPQEGFDTSGLIYYVYQKNGIDSPRTVKSQAFYGVHVDRNELKPGDVVFFSYKGSYPDFNGIYLGDEKFVSSFSGKVAVHSLSTSYYNGKYFGARRFLTSGQTSTGATSTPSTPTSLTNNTGSSNTGSTAPSTVPTLTNTIADSIIETGEKYMGTPYQFGARAYQTNTFDCSSFTQYVFYKNGIKLPRNSRQQSTVGAYVPYGKWQKGDLLFYTLPGYNGRIGHVAIYAGNGKVLHTYGKPGVTYTDMNVRWLKDYYVTARRVIK
ncbi:MULTISPECIES: C40 family peptidase [Tepidibacillus]|uniref:NlpC/P60 domain-containing protein n=1 Tax=Tepidibacillus decaturensis TaxID=1413211 RepID=A0A135L1Y7_9BACI|nr:MULTISPECIES: C40 family peptidase [Tepidibacillus]KXG42917.1 hypothetical protein U473_01900 [Tepidibacillus decaturensis]GBF12443.1 gamma-DL-glutamyl hydrolase precursor [Tepidibacillus sp. HK-1]